MNRLNVSQGSNMTDPFKWRHYESEIILTCVRWYLRYALSYRDLEEIMTERALSVDHSTIFRWIQRYSPELDRRCRSHLKHTNDSCRGAKRAFPVVDVPSPRIRL